MWDFLWVDELFDPDHVFSFLAVHGVVEIGLLLCDVDGIGQFFDDR